MIGEREDWNKSCKQPGHKLDQFIPVSLIFGTTQTILVLHSLDVRKDWKTMDDHNRLDKKGPNTKSQNLWSEFHPLHSLDEGQ